MYIVAEFQGTKEFRSWKFKNKKEAEDFTKRKREKILPGYWEDEDVELAFLRYEMGDNGNEN